ncbi:triacylglycerol lipase [Aeromicrobium sp. Leaf350]|uniref:esterase/lipase family protein n=1 Tax=Aeromicrobium sp. Leaf350 TaxID=2876565 RepID=UPI001E3AEC19|nr:lipase [Aeromicrobium sp. Leaf350]
MRRLLAGLLLTSCVLLAPHAPAQADEAYAPVDRPGPALTIPQAELDASYACVGDFSSPLEALLFVPPTGGTPAETFSWNYGRFFESEGRPYCTVTLPHHSLDDIQEAGEYIVHAIRETYAQTGRPIAVLGHSQGGMAPRWALRFWPDTRAMVADQIGLAPSNHGTTLIDPICSAVLTCTEAVWQQRSTSAFTAALNSGAETFAGTDYTAIYTLTDEVVLPTSGPAPSSALRTGAGRITNVTTQSICPLSVYEHLAVGTIDPVAHALVMDALNHDGPADPARINRSVCLQLLIPGLNPLDPRILQVLSAVPNVLLVPVPLVNVAGTQNVAAEPPLKCYVLAAGCGGSSTGTTGPGGAGSTTTGGGSTPATAVSTATTSVTSLSGSGVVRATPDGLPESGVGLGAWLALVAAAALTVGLVLVRRSPSGQDWSTTGPS